MRNISLKLFNMSSDRRCGNKVKEQVGGTLTGVKFKQPTDLLNPTLLLDLPTIDFNYVELIIKDGDATIWDKFYFLESPPTFELGGLHSIALHEDILSNVWETLREKTAHVERSQNKVNKYIIDDMQGVETTRQIEFTDAWGTLGGSSGAYIALTVAGGV